MCSLPPIRTGPAKMAQTNPTKKPLHRATLHRMPSAPPAERGPMKTQFTRRNALSKFGGALFGVLTFSAARTTKAAVQKFFVSSQAPKGYDPTKHKWQMAFDIEK